jgi:adenylyltransferase/sulfurtransferase
MISSAVWCQPRLQTWLLRGRSRQASWKDKLDRGERITIIDVREPHEWQIANLARYGARLIQLGQFPQCLSEINPADDTVVHCKVGGRSAQAYEVLQHAGYTRIKNLKGGILAWADQVDRSMQKY